MNDIRHLPIAAAMMALALGLPAQIAAYHDVTAAQHQVQAVNLEAQGYRPLTLTIYGTAAAQRYAAVWVQRPGPHFIAFHGYTAAQYQNLVVALAATHAPKIVSACGSGANLRFAGVLEQAGHAAWAQHGLDGDQFDAAAKSARDNGWRIASADCYGTTGNTRYVVTFEPNPEQRGWGYYRAAGAQDHQDRFLGMSQAYARPISTSFNDDGSVYLCCWEDSIVGLVNSHHDLTTAQYNQLANQYWNDGNRYPYDICASGSGPGIRFAASWATTDLPAARQWTTTGAFVPELAAMDAWVQNWLQSNGIRGASLAVVKDGKLKLARGYTWAEPGYGPVQPTSLFRIASCSKPLTSIVVHQQRQQAPGQLAYGTLMASFFNFPAMTDPASNTINVEHLLSHQGGWDSSNSGSGYDPMFYDEIIAPAGNLTYPISATDIRTFMQGQSLDYTPGNNQIYSNYGYTLLARILERVNPGKTFPQLVQERIFTPLGLTRPAIGGAHFADRLPGEVLYHPRALRLFDSVNDNSRPWVPQHYGGWNHANMDGNGAWVMAAPDFAKVLAAFSFGNFNPLLGPPATQDMWTPSIPGGSWLKGWFENTQPVSSPIREHNGILPGTRTYVGCRADGVAFVFFTNGDEWLGEPTGVALSGICDAVSVWPAHDLFPTVGIPGFHQVDDILAPTGSPCPGSTGTPVLFASGSADIGDTASFHLAQAIPGTLALTIVGFAPASIDLGFLGAPGCVLHTTTDIIELGFVGTTGGADFSIAVPLAPALVGARLWVQDAFHDPAANPFGVVTTNAIAMMIGGWLGT